MTRNLLVTVVVAILVSATTAGAAAVIDGGDVVNGSLTGKDVRNKSLTKRDFRGSVRGPRGFRGLQGQQGAPGQKGDTGQRGPSDLYSTYTPERTAAGGVGDVLELLEAPDGDYMVFGNAHVENETADPITVECQIAASLLHSPDSAADWTSLTVPAGGSGNIVLAGPSEVPPDAANDALMFACFPPTPAPTGGDDVVYTNIDLLALQVGTWH